MPRIPNGVTANTFVELFIQMIKNGKELSSMLKELLAYEVEALSFDGAEITFVI